MGELSIKDTRKLEFLFEHYEYYLLCISEKYVGKTTNAEDIVMESFVKIIPHLDKLDCADGHKARNYLVTVVENLALDSLRQREILPLEEELLGDFSDAENLERIIETDEMREYFTRAFRELSLQDKQVLRLKYLQELSHDEISKLLDITESAVRKRLERARKRLREGVDRGPL